MSTETSGDVSRIQDEDMLRKMWQETEDFGRKKEIRSHMYKLREERLKNFYSPGDVTTNIQKTISTNTKDGNGPTHADSLLDHSFLSLKSKEIRDSESPTREIHYKITDKSRGGSNQGWNVVTKNESSNDGKTHTTSRVATTSGVQEIEGGVSNYAAKCEQQASVYSDQDANSYTKAVGASSKSVIQQEAKGGDDKSNFRSSSTTTSSSSKVVSEQRSGDTTDFKSLPSNVDESSSTNIVRKVYTSDAPSELKQHPSYVDGKTKVTRETRTLPDGTIVTSTRYETKGGTTSTTRGSESHTSSSKTSSEQKSSRTSSSSSKFESQSKNVVDDGSNMQIVRSVDNTTRREHPDNKTITITLVKSSADDDASNQVSKNVTTSSSRSVNVQKSQNVYDSSNVDVKNESRRVIQSSDVRDVRTDVKTVPEETRIIRTITTTTHSDASQPKPTQDIRHDTQTIRTVHDDVVTSRRDQDVRQTKQDQIHTQKVVRDDQYVTKEQPQFSKPSSRGPDTPQKLQPDSRETFSTVTEKTTVTTHVDNKVGDQNTIKTVDERRTVKDTATDDLVCRREPKASEKPKYEEPQTPRKQEEAPHYDAPERRQPIRPGKSEMDEKRSPTEGQYQTTYRTDYIPKRISVELSPTHDAFARSLRAITPDRDKKRRSSLKSSTSSLRCSTSPEKPSYDRRYPARLSPDRKTRPDSRETSPTKRATPDRRYSPDKHRSTEIIMRTSTTPTRRSPTKRSPERSFNTDTITRQRKNETVITTTRKDTTNCDVNSQQRTIDSSTLTRRPKDKSKPKPRSRSVSPTSTASDIEYIRNNNEMVTDLDDLTSCIVAKTNKTNEEITRRNVNQTQTYKSPEQRPTSLEITSVATAKKTKKITDRSPTSPLAEPQKKSSSPKDKEKPVFKRRDTYEERCRQILGISDKNETDTKGTTRRPSKEEPKSPTKSPDKLRSPTKDGSKIQEFPSQIRRSPEKQPLEKPQDRSRPTKDAPKVQEFPSQIRRSPEKQPFEKPGEKSRPKSQKPDILEFPSQIRKSPEKQPLEKPLDKDRPTKDKPTICEFPSQIRKSPEKQPLEKPSEKGRPTKDKPTINEFPSQIRKSPEKEPLEKPAEKERPIREKPKIDEFPSQIRKSPEKETIEKPSEKERPTKDKPTISEFPSQIRKSPEKEPLEKPSDKERPIKEQPSVQEFPSQIRRSPEKQSPESVAKKPTKPGKDEIEPLQTVSKKIPLQEEKRIPVNEPPCIKRFVSLLGPEDETVDTKTSIEDQIIETVLQVDQQTRPNKTVKKDSPERTLKEFPSQKIPDNKKHVDQFIKNEKIDTDITITDYNITKKDKKTSQTDITEYTDEYSSPVGKRGGKPSPTKDRPDQDSTVKDVVEKTTITSSVVSPTKGNKVPKDKRGPKGKTQTMKTVTKTTTTTKKTDRKTLAGDEEESTDSETDDEETIENIDIQETSEHTDLTRRQTDEKYTEETVSQYPSAKEPSRKSPAKETVPSVTTDYDTTNIINVTTSKETTSYSDKVKSTKSSPEKERPKSESPGKAPRTSTTTETTDVSEYTSKYTPIEKDQPTARSPTKIKPEEKPSSIKKDQTQVVSTDVTTKRTSVTKITEDTKKAAGTVRSPKPQTPRDDIVKAKNEKNITTVTKYHITSGTPIYKDKKQPEKITLFNVEKISDSEVDDKVHIRTHRIDNYYTTKTTSKIPNGDIPKAKQSPTKTKPTRNDTPERPKQSSPECKKFVPERPNKFTTEIIRMKTSPQSKPSSPTKKPDGDKPIKVAPKTPTKQDTRKPSRSPDRHYPSRQFIDNEKTHSTTTTSRTVTKTVTPIPSKQTQKQPDTPRRHVVSTIINVTPRNKPETWTPKRPAGKTTTAQTITTIQTTKLVQPKTITRQVDKPTRKSKPVQNGRATTEDESDYTDQEETIHKTSTDITRRKDTKVTRTTSDRITTSRTPTREQPRTEPKKPKSTDQEIKTRITRKGDKKVITTKSIIINNDLDTTKEIVVNLQRSQSSREPTPDRICPLPASEENISGVPRYPDRITEPDEPSGRRRPTKISDIPICETEESSEISRITEIDDTKLTRSVNRVEETDESLLTVNQKVTKFVDEAEKLLTTPRDIPERPKSPRLQHYTDLDMEQTDESYKSVSEKVSHFIETAEQVSKPKTPNLKEGPAPKVQRPDLTGVDESIRTDECLLSVSDKVSKFATTTQQLKTHDYKKPITSVKTEVKMPTKPKDKSPTKETDGVTECVQIETDKHTYTRSSKSPEKSPARDSAPKSHPEEKTPKRPIELHTTTIKTDTRHTRKEIPLWDQDTTPKSSRKGSTEEPRTVLSPTGRLRSTESIRKAKELFENMAKEQTVKKQRDILSRPSVFEAKSPRKPKDGAFPKYPSTNEDVKLTDIGVYRATTDVTCSRISAKPKYREDQDVTDTTRKYFSTTQRSSIIRDDNLKSTRLVMDKMNTQTSSRKDDDELPSYMKPLDRKPHSPERERPRSPEKFKAQQIITKTTVHETVTDSEVPGYMRPLDRRPHSPHRERSQSPEGDSYRRPHSRSRSPGDDIPGYMKPLDRRPHSSHRDRSPSPDSGSYKIRSQSPDGEIPGYMRPLDRRPHSPHRQRSRTPESESSNTHRRRTSTPEGDIPGYMRPLDRRPHSPQRDLAHTPDNKHTSRERLPEKDKPKTYDTVDKEIPHYMRPLERHYPSQRERSRTPEMSEKSVERSRDSSVDKDIPGYMRPLERSFKPQSPHKTDRVTKTDTVVNTTDDNDKRTSKFGVVLRRTDSGRAVTSTTTVTERRKSSIKGTDKEELVIEEIYDLQQLEILLEKAVNYEQRRRIRAQIRIVKQLITEKKLTTVVTKKKTTVSPTSETYKTPREKSPEKPSTRKSTEKSRTEYQTQYVRRTSSPTKVIDNKLYQHTDLVNRGETYESSYSYKEQRRSSQTKTSVRGTSPETKPTREKSPEKSYARRSPEKTSKTTTTIQKVRESPEKRTFKTDISTVYTTDMKRVKSATKTAVEEKPIWVTQKTLKKPSEREVSSRVTSSTTSTTKRESFSKTGTSKESKTTDAITSSYGVGPTDANGSPLFGLRALRAQNRSDTTKVQGTVIKSHYYSENGQEPVGEVSVTKYSSDPKDLRADHDLKSKDGVLSVTTTQKFGTKGTPSLKTITGKKQITDIDDEESETTTTTTRRGSVKEISRKFIDNAVETSKNERQSSYPKAGLILRTSSFKDTAKTGTGSREGSPDHEESHKTVTVKKTTTVSSSGGRADTFLNNQSRVTGVQDVISRMRNANDEVQPGDSMEDAEARSLLNKFIGSQVLLSGMESMSVPSSAATTVQRTTTTTSTTTKDGGKPVKVTRTFTHPISSEELENIWDEQTLRLLLERSTEYEERRLIRARLRDVMTEQEACADVVAKAVEEETGTVQEKVETSKKTFTEGPVTTTQVTTRVTSQQVAKKPMSPFAKFRQLDKQNSSTTPPSTPKTPTGSRPLFKFTDPELNRQASTIKERLLQWCQMKTKEYENVSLDNFSSSWADGLGFCALIHHFLPDAFDYHALTPKERRHNFTLAFQMADEKAGIYPLLDVDDMVACRKPDWKCVFTYVQAIYKRFKDED